MKKNTILHPYIWKDLPQTIHQHKQVDESDEYPIALALVPSDSYTILKLL